jgi:hypothetical protein
LYVAVYVAELFAMTSWVAAPPSDQAVNAQLFLPLSWGEGAKTVLRDPWMTVRVKGAGASVPLRASEIPPGLELSVRATVRGSRRRDSVSVSLPNRWP